LYNNYMEMVWIVELYFVNGLSHKESERTICLAMRRVST
jgi:hypothetical protein